jgi:hypothetical protein
MLRRWVTLAFLFATPALLAQAPATPAPLASFDRVIIAPTKTSIYIGTVSMTTPPLIRKNGIYETTYAAKVFPYFFSNESGTLAIEITEAQLRQLEKGDPIEFKGQGVRTDGEKRRVEGKATPTDTTSGKIKVRVFVSKKIELIFNTTYRFEPDAKK